MAKKPVLAPPTLDPMLPTATVPSTAGDIVLCLDAGALIDAEEALIRAGHPDVSLLVALEAASASAVRIFFIIAAQRFQPHLKPEELRDLVTFKNLGAISDAITKVWVLSLPEPKPSEGKADPTHPVE
jgi:hypothetical protein